MEKIQQKVRDLDPANLQGNHLQDLQERVTEIRDYLAEINRLKDNL